MGKGLVVVTGASSGFGAEIAKRFASAGYPILLIARRGEKLRELNLPAALCKSVDVTDPAAFSDAISEAENHFDLRVDCLINNAGVMLLGHVENQDPIEWQRMFETNVFGVLNGMQSVLETMKNRQTGTIINISSVAGVKTFDEHAAYSGTKYAVHGISESVRWEMAPHNVRVITISPGAAETELLNHVTDENIKSSYKDWKSSIGGAMSAKDVADAVFFAYQLPQSVCIRDLVITPTKQQN